jgi:hypothetical protein
VIFVAVVMASVLLTGVWVVREWWWLRRVEKASGDPEAIGRLLHKRRWR